MMEQDKTYAERAFYRVLIDAPIETVWSELIKTSSPRPFFWNSCWDAKAMSAGNAYRVISSDGGTEFTLTTEGIVAGSKSEKSMASGSQFISTNLKAFIETGKATLGARMMLAMFRLMARFTPKSMSADKWPLGRNE